MAMIGGTIGVTFALSLVAGPALNQWIGVPGIFWLTAILSALAILMVKFVVPNPLISRFHSDAEAVPARLKEVLRNPQLLRLNYGIFALHAAQMAMFVVVPFAIKQNSGMGVNDHWKIYLPILLLSFALMLPAIIVGEKRAKLKPVFVSAVALMLLAQLLFAATIHHFWGVVISLGVYFVAFNILEASLPSIISKVAPAASKGTAMGVYNTAQSLGIFVGGVSGGYLSYFYSFSAVFVFCSVLMALWLFFASSMQAPPAVKSKMYHLGEISAADARTLSNRLSRLSGVREAVVIAEEGLVVLKVDMQQNWDEQTALKLIAKGG
jgi:predicted MFS family arabinose efflux permease